MNPGQNHHLEVSGALEGVTVADAIRFVSAGTTGQSKTRQGGTCKIVPNVDEQKVNELLEIGKPLGQFFAFNNCQAFVNEVIEQSTRPTPPGRLDIPIK